MLSSTLADIKCSSVHASGSIYMNISPVAGNGGGGSGGSAGHFAKPGRLKVTVLTETLKVWHHSIARLATSWKTSELQWSICFFKHG